MVYHNNAKLTTWQRKRIKKSKAPYRVLSEKLGVSVSTVSKWKKRKKSKDLSSRPHKIKKSLPPEMAPVLTWMRQDWLLDMDTIWNAMRKTLFPQLSRSSCYRELVRLKIHQLHQLRPKPKDEHGKFHACKPGYIHIDVFRLPRLDGKKRYLFVAIDRATRLMTLRIYDQLNGESGRDFMHHCVKFYPFRVYRTLTDNGGEFSNKSCSGGKAKNVHPFDRICKENKIKHSLTKPFHPWTNGLAERTGGTIKNEVLNRLHFDCMARMKDAIFGFRRYFNEHRPYKAMQGKTPMELVREWYIKKPKYFHCDPDDLFAMW